MTTTDPNIAELTLTSCHPKYTANDRIVVHSVLDPERSSNVGFPTFYSLDGSEAAAPAGDDPVVSGDAIDVVEPATTLGTPGTTSGTIPDASPVTTVATTEDTSEDLAGPVESTVAPSAAAPAGPSDDFGQGWFDDRAAFAQIALWAAALTIISLLAYQISKRFRRISVGLLVGVVPFVIALYFFYQNVNRLLPPGI